VKLLRVLIRQYSIPVSSIRGHRHIPGKATECPGNNFPYRRLISELKK